MAVIGTITEIAVDGSGNTYRFRDANSDSPLVATITIAAGNLSGSYVDSDNVWTNNTFVDTYCSVDGVSSTVSFNVSTHTITVTIPKAYSSALTFKLLGRNLS